MWSSADTSRGRPLACREVPKARSMSRTASSAFAWQAVWSEAALPPSGWALGPVPHLPSCLGAGTVTPCSCPQAHLNVAHVGLHHVQTILPDELPHQLDALLVGCHLGTEIRQVVMQVPGPTATGDLAWGPQGLGYRWLVDRVTTEPPSKSQGCLALLRTC